MTFLIMFTTLPSPFVWLFINIHIFDNTRDTITPSDSDTGRTGPGPGGRPGTGSLTLTVLSDPVPDPVTATVLYKAAFYNRTNVV